MGQRSLGEIISGIESFLAIPILSPDYRTILELFEIGETRPSHLIAQIGVSKSKMFNLLSQLESQGITLVREDPLDSRCRLYSLHKPVIEALKQHLRNGAEAHLNQRASLEAVWKIG